MFSAAQIRVLTVDDHAVFRDGVSAVIGGQADMRVVADASTGAAGAALHRRHRPDVTLMDMRLPDMSGIDAIAIIRDATPDARIVVLTTYPGDVTAARALKAGARGYLLKATLRLGLISAIRSVHAGDTYLQAEVATDIANHMHEEALTAREVEVLQHVAAGLSNRMVANSLDMSEDTAKTHMRSILAKLGANDRTHAVMIGLKRGILEL